MPKGDKERQVLADMIGTDRFRLLAAIDAEGTPAGLGTLEAVASLVGVPERLDAGSGEFGCLKVELRHHTHCGCEAVPWQEPVSMTTTRPRRDQKPCG